MSLQTPGNCPEESIQLSEHGETLKSKIVPVHEIKADGRNGSRY
jgi:hypothetical protein